ncbi:lipoprotein insertase outer membrane protein LolB [Zhongshania guokunii]|uniref:Outer-membrane lipoprotein LolB n=1 Tax=Zhongshania guokunii TaxID=641783 RepID=A0ABV3U494_9GAMM
MIKPTQRQLAKFSAALCLLLLAGCATSPERYPNNSAEQWQLKGKIGLWHDDKKESATIDWQQCSAEQLHIRLSGPLGSGAIELFSDQQGASLSQNGETRRAENIESLAAQAQWPLPVNALRRWVRGRAAPQLELSTRINTSGQLEQLEQAGWTILYRYSHPQQTLPERIEASSADTRLVLMVRDWSEQVSACTPQ